MTTPIAPILPRRTTLFEQVSESVSELIRQGRWKPGEMLPMKSSSPRSSP